MNSADLETWVTEAREQTEEFAERRRAKAKAAAAVTAKAAQDALTEEQGVWDTSDNGEMVCNTAKQRFVELGFIDDRCC